MTFASGVDTLLLINGFDLTAYFKNSNAAGTADTYDTTTYGKRSKVYIPGLVDATMTAEGLFDIAVAGPDTILAAALAAATSPIWTRFPFGDTRGYRGTGIQGVENRYEITAPHDGVVAVTAAVQSAVGPEGIISLHALAADASGTTNGTSLDNAAATTNGGVAYLQVTAEAATTATIKVQHSADNSAWVDLVTFVAVTAANNYQRIAVTGTVNRYLRYTVTATAGTITHQTAFGRK